MEEDEDDDGEEEDESEDDNHNWISAYPDNGPWTDEQVETYRQRCYDIARLSVLNDPYPASLHAIPMDRLSSQERKTRREVRKSPQVPQASFASSLFCPKPHSSH